MKTILPTLLICVLAMLAVLAEGIISPVKDSRGFVAGWSGRFSGNGAGVTNINGNNLNFTNSTWWDASGNPVAQLDINGSFTLLDSLGNIRLSVDHSADGVTLWSKAGVAKVDVQTGGALKLDAPVIVSGTTITGDGVGLTNIRPQLGTNSAAYTKNIVIYITNADTSVYRLEAQRVIP